LHFGTPSAGQASAEMQIGRRLGLARGRERTVRIVNDPSEQREQCPMRRSQRVLWQIEHIYSVAAKDVAGQRAGSKIQRIGAATKTGIGHTGYADRDHVVPGVAPIIHTH
jgi:hypothetical protein